MTNPGIDFLMRLIIEAGSGDTSVLPKLTKIVAVDLFFTNTLIGSTPPLSFFGSFLAP